MILRLAANLMGLVPGLGHVVLGRCGRGVVFFFLFVMFLNGSLLSPYLFTGKEAERVRRGSLLAAGLVWAYAVMDVFHITWWRRRKAFLQRKKRLLLDVHRVYATGRLEEAATLLRKLVRMDPEDPAGHFWRGLVFRDLGRPWRARTSFKQALWVDPAKSWRTQVQHQLWRMRTSGRVSTS